MRAYGFLNFGARYGGSNPSTPAQHSSRSDVVKRPVCFRFYAMCTMDMHQMCTKLTGNSPMDRSRTRNPSTPAQHFSRSDVVKRQACFRFGNYAPKECAKYAPNFAGNRERVATNRAFAACRRVFVDARPVPLTVSDRIRAVLRGRARIIYRSRGRSIAER